MRKLFIFPSFFLFLLIFLFYASYVYSWCSYTYCENGKVCYFPAGYCDSPCSGGEVCCSSTNCYCDSGTDPDYCDQNSSNCTSSWCSGYWGENGAHCASQCSSCFLPNTKISTPGGEKNIQDLKPGDEVKSFDVKTNKETKSIVQKIYETTRSAYYKITLKDGTVLKATGEHPLWAIKANNKPLSLFQYLKTKSLTRKIIDWIREKL